MFFGASSVVSRQCFDLEAVLQMANGAPCPQDQPQQAQERRDFHTCGGWRCAQPRSGIGKMSSGTRARTQPNQPHRASRAEDAQHSAHQADEGRGFPPRCPNLTIGLDRFFNRLAHRNERIDFLRLFHQKMQALNKRQKQAQQNVGQLCNSQS